MQFIHDNIIATLVGGVLIFVLLSLQLGQKQASIESTQYFATKRKQVTLMDMLDRDLENLGSGVPAGEDLILQADQDGLRFRKQLDDGTQAEVAYLREGPVDTLALNDTTDVYVYEVRRIVRDWNDASVADTSGAFDSVTRFVTQLHPYNPADLDDARVIEVTMESVLSSTSDAVQRSSWTSVYRPANLDR